jgi:hypothetical protein
MSGTLDKVVHLPNQIAVEFDHLHSGAAVEAICDQLREPAACDAVGRPAKRDAA